MKGFRFYEEFGNKRKPDTSEGNVVAICTELGSFLTSAGWCWEAAGAVFFRPNSPVAWTSVSHDYLREKCKRISEARAREIHPRLFEYLEWEG